MDLIYSKFYTINFNDYLLGLWDIIPLESEINRMHQTTGFSKVFVNGTRMTFSGGPRNSLLECGGDWSGSLDKENHEVL